MGSVKLYFQDCFSTNFVTFEGSNTGNRKRLDTFRKVIEEIEKTHYENPSTSFSGVMSRIVYSVQVRGLTLLREWIADAIATVTPDVFLDTWLQINYRLDMCLIIQGHLGLCLEHCLQRTATGLDTLTGANCWCNRHSNPGRVP